MISPSTTPCRDCGNQVSLSAQACPKCGASYPYQEKWDGYGFEYKTQATLFGLPWIHIAFKYRTSGMPVVANGVIAIGQFAFGMITVSQFGIGVLALGQFTLAAATIAQITVAAFAICQVGAIFDGIGLTVLYLEDYL